LYKQEVKESTWHSQYVVVVLINRHRPAFYLKEN
jgi:hypothetical protein